MIPPDRESGAREGSQAGPGRQTILLVDDSDLIRSLIAKSLTRAGYEVLEAESGPHALRILDAHERPIDMLVTDMTLPLMDGIQLYMELKARQPRLPVLFVSGNPLSDVPGDFLAKPFKLDELVERVQLALSFGSGGRA